MHDSLINDVKMHVDSISKEKDGIDIKGWCASGSVKVDNIRLSKGGDSFSAVYGNERKDVEEFYENEKFLNSGFTISVPEKFEDSNDLKLEIITDNIWKTVLELNDKNCGQLVHREIDFKISKKLNPEVIVVDNFYENPNEIRDFALSCEFAPHLQYHKGQRTEQKFIPEGIKEIFEGFLNMEITSWEDQGANGVFQFCTAEDALVYHVDTQTYAAVVYLTPDAPASCGTTFFKSGRTGLRSDPKDEDSERLSRSKDELSFEIFRGNFYDKTNLETVDIVGNVYNRLVIWDAKLIHAASEYFGDQKENSRLFHMFFFDAK